MKKKFPDDWKTFLIESCLGQGLLEQKRHVEAEALLLSGCEGLKQPATQIPASVRSRHLEDAVQGLVRLYESWGKPEQAAEWRKKLSQLEERKP